jgi:hypothetical protein
MLTRNQVPGMGGWQVDPCCSFWSSRSPCRLCGSHNRVGGACMHPSIRVKMSRGVSAKKKKRVVCVQPVRSMHVTLQLRLSPAFCFFFSVEPAGSPGVLFSCLYSRSLRSIRGIQEARSFFIFFFWSAANACMGWPTFFSLHCLKLLLILPNKKSIS